MVILGEIAQVKLVRELIWKINYVALSLWHQLPFHFVSEWDSSVSPTHTTLSLPKLRWRSRWYKINVVFVCRNSLLRKLFSKFFCVCLSSRKLIKEKHFPVKEKFGLVFKKVFSGKFGQRTLSGSYEKFRNVIICWLYQIWSSKFWLLYIICFEYLFFNSIS